MEDNIAKVGHDKGQTPKGSDPSSAQTWHYGLIADYWAEFNDDFRAFEIPYFQRYVERGGGPALDVACGTGRVLIPLLRAGLDVDGCDISADMVARCREKAERQGLSPTLWAQPMHELDPPRAYRTLEPLEQRVTLEMRAQRWRAGTLEAEETRPLTIGLYFKNELLLMLERAGFNDVEVQGDHNDAPATSDDDFIVLVAKK